MQDGEEKEGWKDSVDEKKKEECLSYFLSSNSTNFRSNFIYFRTLLTPF